MVGQSKGGKNGVAHAYRADTYMKEPISRFKQAYLTIGSVRLGKRREECVKTHLKCNLTHSQSNVPIIPILSILRRSEHLCCVLKRGIGSYESGEMDVGERRAGS